MRITSWRFFSGLIGLVACLVLLAGHLLLVVLTNPLYFPVNTVKITAPYQHITRAQLETQLRPFLQHGFFGLSTTKLRMALLALDWSDAVSVARVWPDTLKISLQEKTPVAIWNQQLLSAEGMVIQSAVVPAEWPDLPRLEGPEAERQVVLQTYHQVHALLQPYGLSLRTLTLQANQAWELQLTNGLLLRLGKHDLLARINRFCRAYPAVFAEKTNQLATVDLRYAHGMAVHWQP